MCSTDLFMGLLAILFPPLAVWVKRGICSVDSMINILLCMLGYIPGLLHAWYIIAKYPDVYEYESVAQGDYESGYGSRHDGVRYVVVATPYQSQGPIPQPQHHQQQQQQQQSQPMNYGTNASTSHQDNRVAGSSSNNNNNDDRAPPTYDEAIKGDHKLQSRD